MKEQRFTTRLGAGQALSLPVARGPRRLVVTRGRLWLTVTGGADDHWLHAGEGVTLGAGQQAVVEAWPQAEFQILQPVPRHGAARPAVGLRWPGLAGQGA
jgi:hypothetical protein